MSSFSDRVNAQEPMERRHWLQAVTFFLLQGRRLQKLAALLTSGDFLTAKLTNCSPYAVVDDFSKSYVAFCAADETRAQVLESFLTFIFVHDKHVGFDNLVPCLQPLSECPLTRDAIKPAASH